MPQSPALKTTLQILPRLLAGAVIGFASGAFAVRMITRSPASGFPPASAALPAASSSLPPANPAPALPSAADFQSMEPVAKLNQALQLQSLSAEQRQDFLRDCLRQPAPERTPLLALLLAQWAEKQPAEAADWILANLKEPESTTCLNDVFNTWASHDGKTLAEWANAHFEEKGLDLVNKAMTALERLSPVWFARIVEMDCNRSSIWGGMEFDSLRAPGAARAMSAELQGHVAYSSDLSKMTSGSSNRHQEQKWGWNELFERTAVYWHAEDPAACDAWLETFPENARLAARHYIGKATGRP